MLNRDEIQIVKENLKNSYSPYSNFSVSALLKTKNGNTYMGVNIENHGIQSICAERCAFSCAIANGEREFDYIVICGKENSKNILQKLMPCGYCRQFMSEFVEPNFRIFVVEENYVKEYTMEEIFPFSFKLNNQNTEEIKTNIDNL